MADIDLAAMSNADLEDENKRLMAERAVVEAEFKAQQMAIAGELDRRDRERRVARMLSGLSEDDRAALAVELATVTSEDKPVTDGLVAELGEG